MVEDLAKDMRTESMRLPRVRLIRRSSAKSVLRIRNSYGLTRALREYSGDFAAWLLSYL